MSAPAALRAGTEQPPVAADHVDLWVIRLDLCTNAAGLEPLAAGERARAARMRVGGERWGAARAALRRVLGGCLGVEPRRVALETGETGKPRLAPGSPLDLRFSLSHSGGFALIAARLGMEVGVDLERVRADVRGEEIARDVLGMELRGADFFRAWTRREALAKACGRGLAAPLPECEAERFSVLDCRVLPGFAAAVASEGHGWTLRTRPEG